MCGAGIAEANNSHVGYFPCRADYDILYSILLRVADIVVLSVAPLAQKLLVANLKDFDLVTRMTIW
jgi:hypothetical protein